MTLDEAIAKAGAKLDEIFEGRMIDFEDTLRRTGAAETEISEQLEIQRTLFADWRATTLKDLSRQISGPVH